MRDGKYVDQKTGELIDGKPVIGHKNESWKEYQENPANHGKTREQVIKDYNNPENLGYENSKTSSSDGGKFKGCEH